jgi:type I restriction enzyme S subunit
VRKGWGIKTLGDLYEITSSKRVFKSEWKNCGVPFYRAREIVKLAKQGFVKNDLFISEEMYNEYSLKYGIPKEGDIMVTGVGTLGICYVVNKKDKFYFKDGNIIWLKRKSEINSKYVEYAFKSDLLRKHIDNSAGATVGTFTIIKAKNTNIPVPPLSEQKQIVSILDEVFEGIAKAKANAEKNLANASEIFESYLQDLFVNKKPGWKEAKLNDLCEKITKGSSPKWQGIKYVEEPGILFVTSENVGVNKMILNTRKYVEERFNLLEKKAILKRGDVLTNIVGASIGRTAIFECDDIANINQAVCILRCKTDLLYNRFLSYLLNSPFLKAHLHENEVNNARANLSLGFFSNLKLNIPSLKEQKTIVSRIDEFAESIEKLEAVYLRKLSDLQELKKSILQKAFSGDLIRRAS